VWAADIPRIARGQGAAEEAMARQANRLLFCDTDLVTTVLWSDILFGSCPEWITSASTGHRYDLTLLLTPEVPWTADRCRYQPNESERWAFFERMKHELECRHRPYVIIAGQDWELRRQAAIVAVARLYGILGVEKDAG
jgi:HTH-type transcriptional regulator, transcriptional repressor of NAD biosynthesis genes